uniref:Uncharacterized protein n=1 Tax=Rhizobium rhizogenes TaxID=359 RepID=A0A7S5DQI0_RHIRH|nr:hypothetical protein pC6.5b_285 [Rhizobium rhizogenes]
MVGLYAACYVRTARIYRYVLTRGDFLQKCGEVENDDPVPTAQTAARQQGERNVERP